MAMTEVRKIDVASAAKLSGGISAVIGLVFGILMGLLSVALSGMMGTGAGMGSLGLSSVIVLPILYGIMGLIYGAIGAIVYNVIAGKIGGLKIDI